MPGRPQPRSVRDAAKTDWVTGEYSSLNELARAHAVSRRTLERWKADDSWDLAREVYLDELDRRRAKRLDELDSWSQKHMRATSGLQQMVEGYLSVVGHELQDLNARIKDENTTEEDRRRLRNTVASRISKVRALADIQAQVQRLQRESLGLDSQSQHEKIVVEFVDLEDRIRRAIDAGVLPGDPRSLGFEEEAKEDDDDGRDSSADVDGGLAT